MIPNETSAYEKLHAVFCSGTGREIKFTMQKYFQWEHWAANGWTAADLKMVIDFIKRKIKAGERRAESLRFDNLLEPARFEEDLVDARGWNRKPKIDQARKRTLESTGRRGEPPQPAPETAGQVLERTKLAQQLKEWKEKNL